MEVVQLEELPDVKIIRPKRFSDNRGFFSETYNKRLLQEAGINAEFIQDNHSRSADVGTVRGLHFQLPPWGQTKLVRVVRGSALDVIVDIRAGSPTEGRHAAVVLSVEEWNQVLVPVGFAHGFCTLEPDTEIQYKVDGYYAPEHERGLAWDDPALGIDWPVSPEAAVLSDKDRRNPTYAELEPAFRYDAPSC